MLTKTKIYISSPHMGGNEQKFVFDALDTNWVSTIGSNIDAFENDIQYFLENTSQVTALSSGKDVASENLFDKGLCLPSGSNLTENDLDRILSIITKIPNL